MSSAKRFIFSKKTITITSVVIVVLIGCAATGLLMKQNSETANKISPKAVDSPAYTTVLPEGKSVSKLGGWTRISPPTNDPVYAYADKIGSVSITVSEQPLPASFKNNVDTQVGEVAKKFNATTQFQANDTKVYIGTSAKGPQSLIFTKNNTLVLIKSLQKVEDKSWVAYINSLK